MGKVATLGRDRGKQGEQEKGNIKGKMEKRDVRQKVGRKKKELIEEIEDERGIKKEMKNENGKEKVEATQKVNREERRIIDIKGQIGR